jgi:LacI family transcriptional regulator
VVLCNSYEDESKEAQYVELAVSEQAADVIISPHTAHTPIERLHVTGIPVVVIDRRVEVPVDSVLADSRGGAHAATEHLIAQGWRHPACITGRKTTETAMLRGLGYKDAMRGARDPRPPVLHRPFTIPGGRDAAAALLDVKSAPDAFFAANAALGLGVLHELRAPGLRPGRDVGLICFDDAPWAPFIDPPISVVSHPAADRILGARLDIDSTVHVAAGRDHRRSLLTALDTLRHLPDTHVVVDGTPELHDGGTADVCSSSLDLALAGGPNSGPTYRPTSPASRTERSCDRRIDGGRLRRPTKLGPL